MTDVAGTLARNRRRLNEVAAVLARHGLAEWAARGRGIAGLAPVEELLRHVVKPEYLEASRGERLRGALTELGTTYIKFGQMLSLRPDVVGQDVAPELAKLQANVPADPPGAGARTVEAQLGRPVAELFGSFEPEPFASGSVAQVHRATLADGTPVAVKVLHDGADIRVREDIEILRAVAGYMEREDPGLAQLRPAVIVAEFAAMMNAAVDLREELANMQIFQSHFAGERDIVIPAPYPELSGQKVLTMALISGSSLSDRASVEATGWDAEKLVSRAAEVYLEMIFRDGVYHADPHPGNFLLPDDEHMALLDFGDVGRLSSLRRGQLETMVIAIGTRDIDSLVDVVLEITTPPPSVDLSDLRPTIELWLNRYLLGATGDFDISGIIGSAMEVFHENSLVLPADMSLLFKVLISLQGLGAGVGVEVRVNELLRPHVSRMLQDRYDPKRMAMKLGRSLRHWDHFITGLPEQMEAILEQVRTGRVAIEFRVHDPDQVADKVVDGLVSGLVTAASVIAGAQLISRRTEPMLGPVSAPGLVAVGVGGLAWLRLVVKRRAQGSWVGRATKAVQLAQDIRPGPQARKTPG